MMLDAKSEKLAGIVVDTGTGKRIPFVRKFDPSSNFYEAIQAAPNGIDYQCDEDGNLVIVRGRAVGELKLVPLDQAADLAPKPQKVKSTVHPMSADQKLEGLETYQRVYRDVWTWRGESRRCVDQRWSDFLAKNSFLDAFVLRRRSTPVQTAP